MARYVQDKNGKMRGSIGDGKTDIPTSSDTALRSSASQPENPDVPTAEAAYGAYTLLADSLREQMIGTLEEAARNGTFAEAWERLRNSLPTTHDAAVQRRSPTAPAELVDLSGIDLERADLSGVDLRGVCLSGANLRNADLSGANLCSSTFVGADMARAKLSRAKVRNSCLREADLSSAHIYGTDFGNTDLTGSRLALARGTRVKFPEAILDRVDLQGAVLEFADLRSASCRETDFTDVEMPGANVNDAKMGTAFILPKVLEDTNGHPNWR